MVQAVREFAATEGAEVVTVCARIEEEVAELDDEEKAEFLAELGIKESDWIQLIRKAYTLLGLGTYFTAGEKRVQLLDSQTGDESTNGRNHPYRL